MAKLVEISGQIENGMWDYHEIDLNGAILPPVNIRQAASVSQHGFDAHELHFNTLTGTYLETAAHLVDGQPTIEQVPIANLVRPAHLLRLPDKSPGTMIRVKELIEHDPHLQPREALIIQTGWGQHWNQPDYVTRAPRFELECLDWLMEQPFSIFGLDTPVANDSNEFLLRLYTKSMLMIAPCVNLEQITQAYGTLMVFPLNIVGVCSAPCRAIYLEDTFWA